MSVNLLRSRGRAMLAPAFPWHPVLSVCIFVGTCSFGGWVAKLDFFSPHTRRCKRGKIRESSLSALTRENKKGREDGETASISRADREMNVWRSSAAATPLLHCTEILPRPVIYTDSPGLKLELDWAAMLLITQHSLSDMAKCGQNCALSALLQVESDQTIQNMCVLRHNWII